MSSAPGETVAAAPGHPGASTRIAFVGQSGFFRQCALEGPAGSLDPEFVDFRSAAPAAPLIARLQELDPDVIVVFRPEIIPPKLFAPLRAVTIGYLTEPLPRGRGRNHPDLQARMWWLEQVDRSNFDRIVSFDPLIAETAGAVIPVWRSLPLPVADSLFMEPHERSHPPRILFVGRSTEHREQLLAPAKAAHRILHIAHGLHGDLLLRFLRRTDVQINLHNNPYPSFENRVSIALAAGHLVISEPLSPSHGLEPGVHFLEINDGAELLALLDQLSRDPDAYAEVQAAGRQEAERFRASSVYPELIGDALADVGAGGSRRGD